MPGFSDTTSISAIALMKGFGGYYYCNFQTQHHQLNEDFHPPPPPPQKNNAVECLGPGMLINHVLLINIQMRAHDI